MGIVNERRISFSPNGRGKQQRGEKKERKEKINLKQDSET